MRVLVHLGHGGQGDWGSVADPRVRGRTRTARRWHSAPSSRPATRTGLAFASLRMVGRHRAAEHLLATNSGASQRDEMLTFLTSSDWHDDPHADSFFTVGGNMQHWSVIPALVSDISLRGTLLDRLWQLVEYIPSITAPTAPMPSERRYVIDEFAASVVL